MSLRCHWLWGHVVSFKVWRCGGPKNCSVLRQYYSVLQSTTPVLLCTTQYYSGAVLQAKLGHYGRRMQRPATFKGLMVRSTSMKIEKIEALWKEKKTLARREMFHCVYFSLCICGNPWKAWKNRHSYKSTKTIFPERPAFDCGGLCPLLFIEIGYPVVNKFFRSSMILPMTACVAQPILDRELFKQRVATFFDILQRGHPCGGVWQKIEHSPS